MNRPVSTNTPVSTVKWMEKYLGWRWFYIRCAFNMTTLPVCLLISLHAILLEWKHPGVYYTIGVVFFVTLVKLILQYWILPSHRLAVQRLSEKNYHELCRDTIWRPKIQLDTITTVLGPVPLDAIAIGFLNEKTFWTGWGAGVLAALSLVGFLVDFMPAGALYTHVYVGCLCDLHDSRRKKQFYARNTLNRRDYLRYIEQVATENQRLREENRILRAHNEPAPQSLRELSRRCIRQQLGPAQMHRVAELPIPATLHDYIRRRL